MSIIKEADPTLISIAFSFSFVFWIDASSSGTITQGLRGICNLHAAQSSGLDGSPESALHWIGSLKENYMMVFDNADVLLPAQLETYFPPPRKGSNIVITSRNAAMQSLTLQENSLEVTEMEENDAIELLLKASCLDPCSIDLQAEATKIVKELSYHPLAIDQAGAYIASGATTIGKYLTKYFEHRKVLLSHPEFTGASKYNRTVYETWEISYKEIQQRAEFEDSPKANAANSAMLLLEIFPFFHHEGMTEEIFSYAAVQKDQKTSNPELPLASSVLDQRLLPLNEAGTWDNLLFGEGIRVLLSFSLIKKGPFDGVYAMHPLVHTWGRDRLTLNERKKCCLKAYVTLSCSLREDESQPYGFQRVLVTHVRANMEYSRAGCNQNGISYLDDAYAKFGDLLQKQGYTKEAGNLQIKVLDTRNRILGVEHPDTIRAMASLASTNRDLGKYIEAEKLEIQVLQVRNRMLGVEHPDTIHAMGNLAETYYELGKYREAEKLEIQVLNARNRILGVEHQDTIRAMGNLAATHCNLGKFKEAEELEIQVLDARNRILGVEHPDTIRAMSDLAVIYHSLGKYTEAENMKIEVLDARNRILGVEHPDTIIAMENLAATYHSLGKYTEAEKLKIEVLDARDRILGVEHPDTIRAMEILAVTYHSLGKYAEAEKLNIEVLNARKRILGVEHPDTTTAMSNLAATYHHLGKYTESEKLKIEVLNLRTRILGMEDPDTITAMSNLAATYHGLGKYTEAEKLKIEVLDLRNKILGVGHPNTITAMSSLAATYHSLGKYTEAEKLETQVLDARNRILGVEHPDTITDMENLAATYYDLGKHREGEKLQIKAQEAQSHISGGEHSHNVMSMSNVEESQDTQVLDAWSMVSEEGISDSIQVVLNPSAVAILPHTIINPKKKGV